jgi:hypothetical protein
VKEEEEEEEEEEAEARRKVRIASGVCAMRSGPEMQAFSHCVSVPK